MLFKKKKTKMIDMRELQKRGVVRLPKKTSVVTTNNEGFVDLSKSNSNSFQTSPTEKKSNSDFFGFMNSGSSENTESFSTDSNGYNKREVDTKIIELDNKIYKLEQRIELLERKAGVNQPTESVGTMGW